MEKPNRQDFQEGAQGDKEFNTAVKQWTDSQKTPQSSAKKLTKFTAPAPVELHGTIVHVGQAFASRFGTGVMSRTIELSDGSRFVISDSLYKSNAKYLQLGLEVTIKGEKRIKDKTGYINTDGQELAHKSDGIGFQSVALTEGQAIALSKEDNRYASKVDAIGQVQDKIAALIGDNKQALGTALAGSFAALAS